MFDLPARAARTRPMPTRTAATTARPRSPAWEMIRFSINIMRGCFGGCTFCSITEHEAASSRAARKTPSSARSGHPRQGQGLHRRGLRPGRPHRQHVPPGLPQPEIEAACRKPSCVYPGICQNLGTDHDPLIQIYRRARALKGVKKILIGSGLRYDLAVTSPEYVKELVTTTWAAT